MGPTNIEDRWWDACYAPTVPEVEYCPLDCTCNQCRYTRTQAAEKERRESALAAAYRRSCSSTPSTRLERPAKREPLTASGPAGPGKLQQQPDGTFRRIGPWDDDE